MIASGRQRRRTQTGKTSSWRRRGRPKLRPLRDHMSRRDALQRETCYHNDIHNITMSIIYHNRIMCFSVAKWYFQRSVFVYFGSCTFLSPFRFRNLRSNVIVFGFWRSRSTWNWVSSLFKSSLYYSSIYLFIDSKVISISFESIISAI